MAERRVSVAEEADFLNRFERAGLGIERLVEKVVEGVSAMKVIVGKDGTEHEVPDNTARHKYVETCLRLIGHGKAEEGRTTNVLIINTLAERIKEARERVNSELRVKGELMRLVEGEGGEEVIDVGEGRELVGCECE
jgi:hypothetical protein